MAAVERPSQAPKRPQVVGAEAEPKTNPQAPEEKKEDVAMTEDAEPVVVEMADVQMEESPPEEKSPSRFQSVVNKAVTTVTSLGGLLNRPASSGGGNATAEHPGQRPLVGRLTSVGQQGGSGSTDAGSGQVAGVQRQAAGEVFALF